MSNVPSPSPAGGKRCGCGKTKNPHGFCDGSHAAPAPAPARKACGCGRTQDAQGACDGSHARKP
ncbi:MAG: hypothetical protein FJ397_09210 [Verrucomicrobia bacterium]|nr:hypothetical protein [Verrucomicrobiota bacterium]